MAQMQIGRGRVEPELDLQGRPGASRALELLSELGLDDDVGGPPPDYQKLLVDRAELQEAQSTGVVSHRFWGCKATSGRRRVRAL